MRKEPRSEAIRGRRWENLQKQGKGCKTKEKDANIWSKIINVLLASVYQQMSESQRPWWVFKGVTYATPTVARFSFIKEWEECLSRPSKANNEGWFLNRTFLGIYKMKNCTMRISMNDEPNLGIWERGPEEWTTSRSQKNSSQESPRAKMTYCAKAVIESIAKLLV